MAIRWSKSRSVCSTAKTRLRRETWTRSSATLGTVSGCFDARRCLLPWRCSRLVLGIGANAAFFQLIDTVRLRDSLRPLAAGVIGPPLAVAAMRAASTLLFGLSPTDPPTMFGATALLAVASALAGAVSAWRAARVDPSIALPCD